MFRKCLSVLMCILLIMPITVMYASAVEPEFETHELSRVEKLKLPEDKMPEIKEAPKTAPARKSAGADDPYTFYSTLTNDMQRLIYNTLVSENAGLGSMVNGSTDDIEINVTSTDGSFDFTNQSGFNTIANNAFDALEAALMCFAEDHPQYFWVGAYGAGTSYERIGTKYRAILIIYLSVDTSAYANWGVVKSDYNILMNWVDSFKVEGNTRYQKIKSIHDTICSQVSYDTTFTNPIAHEPVSVCISPYKPVCEGYAEAFKLICDRELIPCITVIGNASGEAHKWNYVKMDDGKWYGMDVTWDDQTNTCYDYFLAGKNTQCYFFASGSFENKHTPTGEFFMNSSETLTYPDYESISYSAALPMYNTKITFDAVNGKIFIPKSVVLNDQFVAKLYSVSDHTVTVSGSTTGATVKATAGGTTKTYKVARWGDVNADGNVNSTDYNTIKNVVKGTTTITANTPKEWAADFDGDGAIDAFDMYYMDMYLNNHIDR